ncbi:MAG: hypothetical protein JWP26_1218 [Devosia sp.]|nr:hypothetical protein [Devosia sp.]
MKPQTTIKSGLAILALLGMALPAMAACPSLPDGPASDNVTNGQQQALCLQQELHDSTMDRNAQTQFDSLKSTIQQQQIQRRFDQLPTITRPTPWDRK